MNLRNSKVLLDSQLLLKPCKVLTKSSGITNMTVSETLDFSGIFDGFGAQDRGSGNFDTGGAAQDVLQGQAAATVDP
jgi:hypothetical protein